MIEEQVYQRSLGLIREKRDSIAMQIINGQCQRGTLKETGAAYMKAIAEVTTLIFSETSLQQAWNEIYQIKDPAALETQQDDAKSNQPTY